MNIETWRSFILLNEVGSIAKAAEQTFQSPQGLNYSITALENELGVPLFERNRKGVKLTRYGEAVLDDALAIVEHEQEIRNKISYVIHNADSQINIGVVNSLNLTFGPIIYDYYKNKQPDESFFIEEFTPQQLNRALHDGRMDLGFSFDCYPNDNLNKILLTEEGWCLICNKTNPLAEKDSICFKDLKDQKVAIANHNYKDFAYFTRKSRESGVNLEIMLGFATGDYGVLSFLEKDIGVMLCATYMEKVITADPLLCSIPFNENLDPYRTCLLYKSNTALPGNIMNLISYIQQETIDK